MTFCIVLASFPSAGFFLPRVILFYDFRMSIVYFLFFLFSFLSSFFFYFYKFTPAVKVAIHQLDLVGQTVYVCLYVYLFFFIIIFWYGWVFFFLLPFRSLFLCYCFRSSFSFASLIIISTRL